MTPSEIVSQSPSHPARINSTQQSSPILPARLMQLPLSRSTIDTTNADLDHAEKQGFNNRPTRSSSLILSPSEMDSPYWHGQPKIFPGLVHERTRRTSMRRGSDSDNHPASLAGDIDARDQRQRVQQRSMEGDADDDSEHANERTGSDST